MLMTNNKMMLGYIADFQPIHNCHPKTAMKSFLRSTLNATANFHRARRANAAASYSLVRHNDKAVQSSKFAGLDASEDDFRYVKHRIAVLIDGDNAESNLIAEFIAEAGRFGKVTVKRIYADWTSLDMKSWKEKLNSHAVRPIQKFAYTKSKNSTDTALIIDAMDLLHSKLVDGFCIVSSDSDYTGLAHRIREEGLFIMGIGRSHTPVAFVRACESFTFAEILSTSVSPPAPQVVQKANKTSKRSTGSKRKKDAVVAPPSIAIKSTVEQMKQPIDLDMVRRAFSIAVNIDNGQAMLSRVSETLRTQDPTFDPRNFGYSSFKKFCDALHPHFEVVVVKDNNTMFLRERQETSPPSDSNEGSTEEIIPEDFIETL